MPRQLLPPLPGSFRAALAAAGLASQLVVAAGRDGSEQALAAHVQALPQSQEEFFDLLPVEYPFAAPEQAQVDAVAGRLAAACRSTQDLAALAVSASQLHAFNIRPDGAYDLALPDFDRLLGEEDTRPLLQTCEVLAAHHAWLATSVQEMALLCPGSCLPTALAPLMRRAHHQCNSSSASMHAGALEDGALDSFVGVAARAQARAEQNWREICADFGSGLHAGEAPSLTSLQAKLRAALAAVTAEVRIFLDHAFQALALSRVGLPAMEPLSTLFAHHAPAFEHVPVAGQRWDVLRSVLENLPRASTGLRVAEIGIEKGMTVTFLMRHVPAISEYVLVDPWHIPGKPAESNAILESYHQNLQAWAADERIFQRNGASAARFLRMSSEAAAGHVENDYFDLVFIDGEHEFEAVRRDIQVWKRRVRPDGGILAGHDFSLFHPAAALAVLVECGPASDDFARFPLETDKSGRPLVRLAADSVWWVRRAGQHS